MMPRRNQIFISNIENYANINLEKAKLPSTHPKYDHHLIVPKERG
jgi:hypothetical protein